MYNDRTVLLPNFKPLCQIQAELHSLKVEKLDACIRLFFANSVTYIYTQLAMLHAWLHIFFSSHWEARVLFPEVMNAAVYATVARYVIECPYA